MTFFCESNFLTFNDFCRKFAIKTNFLTYYGLCNAIPQKWIRLLKESNPNTPTNSEYVGKISFPANQLLDFLSVRNLNLLQLREECCKQISTSKQSVQFIIFPSKWPKISDSPFSNLKLCTTSCQPMLLYSEIKTLNHLFDSCPNVQTFWQSFSRWWNVKKDDVVVLNEETIICGFTNGFSQERSLNLCLIIAQYYIYCASRDGENYYFEAFLAYLKSKLSIEKSKCKSQIILWTHLPQRQT